MAYYTFSFRSIKHFYKRNQEKVIGTLQVFCKPYDSWNVILENMFMSDSKIGVWKNLQIRRRYNDSRHITLKLKIIVDLSRSKDSTNV